MNDDYAGVEYTTRAILDTLKAPATAAYRSRKSGNRAASGSGLVPAARAGAAASLRKSRNPACAVPSPSGPGQPVTTALTLVNFRAF